MEKHPLLKSNVDAMVCPKKCTLSMLFFKPMLRAQQTPPPSAPPPPPPPGNASFEG